MMIFKMYYVLHLIWGKKARINKIRHQLSRIITLNMWTQVQQIQHKTEPSKVRNTRTYSMFENHDNEAN